MFNNNKYTKYYYGIINNALLRESASGYTEKHHIIPRALGGLNNKENIAILTGREHYICHLLLTRMLNGKNKIKMEHAAWMMASTRKINSYFYSLLKEQYAVNARNAQLGIPKPWISVALKGKKSLEETNKKRREALKNKPRSESTKLKISLSKKGKTWEEIYGKEEAKAKRLAQSKRNKNRIYSENAKLKQSLALKGKPWSEARRTAQLNKKYG